MEELLEHQQASSVLRATLEDGVLEGRCVLRRMGGCWQSCVISTAYCMA